MSEESCSRCRKGSSTSKREAALNQYMQLARSRNKGKQSYQSMDPLIGQVLINIGRMEYDISKAKGVLDKSFPLVKLPLHKDCSYTDMLSKCIEYCWGESTEEYEYYVADGGGTSIGCSAFTITSTEGTQSDLPWTLKNYLQVSSVRYPSRLRLYCVRKLKTAEESAVESADSTSDGEGGRSTSAGVDGGRVLDESPTVSEKEPAGYFEVIFEVPKRSKYRPSTSFRSATQQDYLYYGEVDDERTLEVRSLIDAHPNKLKLFMDNPLAEGCFLRSIIQGDKELNFIKNLNLQAGEAEYEQAVDGAFFDVWTGCYLYGGIALLVCVAINGYHSVASYSWIREENGDCIGTTPLLYTGTNGIHISTATYGNFLIKCTFVVKECSVEMINKETQIRGVVTVDPPSGSQLATEDPSAAEELPQSSAGVMTVEEATSIMKSCDDPEKLELLSVVGQGAFGQVHKAVWRGTVVAAKVVPLAGSSKAIDNELSVYKTLHHPNILNFMGILSERTRIVILTNYVRGHNLYELLHHSDTKIKLQYARKLDICIQICQALVCMHSSTPPIVHLDLKPENILVERSTFHVFVADFGLGKVLTECHPGRTTMRAGTPAFQPPEQLRGEMVGRGTDIYALACIVAEVFGEKPVWENLPPNTIILKVASGTYPSTDHLSSNISEVLKRCFVPAESRISAPTFLKALCELL